MYMGKFIQRLKNKVKSNQRLKIILEPRLVRWIKERSPAEFITWCLIQRLKVKGEIDRRLWMIPEHRLARRIRSGILAEFLYVAFDPMVEN